MDEPAATVSQMFSLAGRSAVVTGAAMGIGRAMAIGFASAGADVICVDLDGSGAAATAEVVRRQQRRALEVQADITKIADVDRIAIRSAEFLGHIDLLVNCAGVTRRHPAEEFPEEDWDWILDVNLKGTFLCCQAMGRLMISNGGGRIVNLASIGGLVGYANTIAYLASKGGVVQLTRGLAVEWARHHINVNAIAPGVVMTPMQEQLRTQQPEKFDEFLANMPISQPAQPEDIVAAGIFLCSPASSLITGHTLPVDGGYVAR